MICQKSGLNGFFPPTVPEGMRLCNCSAVIRENRASKSYDSVTTSWLLMAISNKLYKRLKR